MSKDKCQEITPMTRQSEDGSEPILKSSKKGDVEVMKMRSPMHLPLTPLGTPEKSVPRSAETFHKTTLSGRTIDIMILPRTANDDNEKKDGSGISEPGMTGPEFLANLPEGISACPFLEHGCHKVGSELDVKVHIRDDRIFHLVLLCRAVLDLKAAQLKALREQPQRIMRTEEQLTPAYTVLKKYGPAAVVSGWSSPISAYKRRVTISEYKTTSRLAHDSRIRDLWPPSSTNPEGKTYPQRPQCIFHIPQIHNVISDARKSGQNLVVSQPFETHRFGYKMTLLVAPYGDAEVSRQYISIFATIVKGDYDAIQCWPFKLPITFTLYAVDPNKNLERVFIPNPTTENDAFLGRPKGARNAAFGIQRFCALNDLDNYTIKGGLFIGAHVDLSGLHRARRMPSDEL